MKKFTILAALILSLVVSLAAYLLKDRSTIVERMARSDGWLEE